MEIQFVPDGASIELPSAIPKEMISLSRMEDGRTKVRINSSSLDLIQTCLRKTHLSLVEGWKKTAEAPATLFGTAIHKALEVFYSGDPAERKLPALETMELMSYGHVQHGEDSSVLLQATRAFVDKMEALSALPETDKRSVQNGVYTLWHYFKTYLNDPYATIHDEQGPFIERVLSCVLYSDMHIVIEYFGTVDLGVRHVETNELFICDHKTSSVVGNDFFNRLKPNHQYTGYLFLANANGLQTNSFLVNCVQVKERPKTARGTPPSFPRQVTTRTEEDYAEFIDVVVFGVKLFLERLEAKSWPLGPVGSCAAYGGCQFLQVCGAPSEMHKTILNAKFTKGESLEVK